MNQHSFNIKVATQYGVNCAVLLQNIYYWVEKNQANNKHFHDGYYWTYNSNKAFRQQFEYMTAKQIRHTLEVLQNEGLILTGNYNKGCDRTLWYTVTEKGFNILSGIEESKHESIVEIEEIEEFKNDLPDVVEPKHEELSIEKTCQKGQNDLPKQTTSICPPGQMELPSGSNGTNKIPQIKTTNINLEKEIYKEKDKQECVCLEIFECWNSKNLLKCSELTNNLKAVILSALKSFTLKQIKLYIDRYDEMLNAPEYWFSHNWSLRSFLTQGNAISDFTDTGEKWLNYSKWLSDRKKSNNQNYIHNKYTEEQISSLITNLDEVEV